MVLLHKEPLVERNRWNVLPERTLWMYLSNILAELTRIQRAISLECVWG